MDAALSQVTQTFFIILDVFPKVASLGFDMFVYRDTLYYRPFQADRFDQFLSFHNFFDGPHFTVGNVV